MGKQQLLFRFKDRALILLEIGAVVFAVYWLLVKSSVLAESSFRKNIEWPHTDFSKAIVDLNEIQSGGPPKDGIPAIDKPEFISVEKADLWLDAREPVISLAVNNEINAYPLQLMIFHEIVNDKVGGIPVAITFCPLCNASIVFDRRVDGKVLDFGTTGKLRMSDMVMYDRQTESWWQQFSGLGIVGDFAGTRLKQISADIIAYEDFRSAYPGGKVLSYKTGYIRPYGRNPYIGYDKIDDIPYLFDGSVDDRLPAMERVIFVRINGRQRLYPFGLFASHLVINDEIEALPVVIFSKQGTLSVLDASDIKKSRLIPSATAWSRLLNGNILHFEYKNNNIRDIETGSVWNLLGQSVAGPMLGQRLRKVESGVHFAFAWLAFNPDSEIYSLQ